MKNSPTETIVEQEIDLEEAGIEPCSEEQLDQYVAQTKDIDAWDL